MTCSLAREAATHHWAGILNKHIVMDTDAAASPSYPAATAAMRRADAHGLDPAALLPRLASRDELQNSDDPLALLGHRLEQLTDHASGTGRARMPRRMIAGLIPAAAHVTDPDMRRALDERATLIEHRAAALARQAITDRAPWLRELGSPPQAPQQREQWIRCVTTIAAYRDRHNVTDLTALGHQPARNDDWALRADRCHAQRAVQDAREISGMLDVVTFPAAQRSIARSPTIDM